MFGCDWWIFNCIVIPTKRIYFVNFDNSRTVVASHLKYHARHPSFTLGSHPTSFTNPSHHWLPPAPGATPRTSMPDRFFWAFQFLVFFITPVFRGSVRQIELADRQFFAGAQARFQRWGPIPWSRLLYITKYGWYTQFRALQSAAA